MGVPRELFDDDYLYFYEPFLSDERSDADAEVIARLLDLRPGMRVLDVPCGHGRIAGRLARAGCEVVGIDYTPKFIELARARHPQATFTIRDMRELDYDAEFDAVVNWYTSFGYFDPDTNDAVLASFARALKRGGGLVLELHNPARLASILALTGGTSASVTERDGDLMVDRFTIDAETGRSRTERFLVRDGRVRRIEFTLEQVPADRLTDRLHTAGFEQVELFGARGSAYDPDGPRLIAVARR
jgi:SAM-dependent methyltransferase